MTYSKTVTNYIVECWALGFTAEETRDAIKQNKHHEIGLATIYRHRHNLTAQHLIDELIRQQERDILKSDADNRELAMRYRNELLKILVPVRIEQLNKNLSLIKSEETIHVSTNRTEDEVLSEAALILERKTKLGSIH